MLQLLIKPLAPLRRSVRGFCWAPERRYGSTASEKKISKPLRILFCGSDEFSCASLEALHAEGGRNRDLIRSIDVVVRPPKPTGRGNKIIRRAPLQTLAEQLGLRIHERDTFTGWQPPLDQGGGPVNLIVAVSFGLFVPRRLLRAAAYGGLNVHPSLLPDLRGPAPLHHALLARRSHTGVSLQTLSEEAFDAGVVLAQTPPPGVPVPPACAVTTLRDILAPLGAEMLVRALRDGLHVPPLVPIAGWAGATPSDAGGGLPDSKVALRHAPKITKEDTRVVWTGPGARDAEDLAVRASLLGPLWGRALRRDGEERRLILEGVEEAPRGGWPEEVARFVEARKRALGGRPEGHIDGELRTDESTEGAAGKAPAKVAMRTVNWIEEAADGGGGRRDGPGKDARRESTVRLINVPYFPDGEDIIVPTHGGGVRIRRIKVEGDRSRPAAAVVESFSTK